MKKSKNDIAKIVDEIRRNRKKIRDTVENNVYEEKATAEELETAFQSITRPIKKLEPPLQQISVQQQESSNSLKNISRKVDAFPAQQAFLMPLQDEALDDNVFKRKSVTYN